MSLIGTAHKSGPNATASSIDARTAKLTIASRCRQNRRQVSNPGEVRSVASTIAGETLAVGDARVEPAIENVGNQVEQDYETGKYEGHRHDHRRIVGENGADQH